MSGKDKPVKMVFTSTKNDTICIVRNYVYPTLTDQNTLGGARFKSAASLWPNVNPLFIKDCKTYANAYNSQVLSEKKLPISAYNVFFMGVCKVQSIFTSLGDISTTIGSNINEWMENGFLPKVNTSSQLTAQINLV
jgi:hypothetical protein